MRHEGQLLLAAIQPVPPDGLTAEVPVHLQVPAQVATLSGSIGRTEGVSIPEGAKLEVHLWWSNPVAVDASAFPVATRRFAPVPRFPVRYSLQYNPQTIGEGELYLTMQLRDPDGSYLALRQHGPLVRGADATVDEVLVAR